MDRSQTITGVATRHRAVLSIKKFGRRTHAPFWVVVAVTMSVGCPAIEESRDASSKSSQSAALIAPADGAVTDPANAAVTDPTNAAVTAPAGSENLPSTSERGELRRRLLRDPNDVDATMRLAIAQHDAGQLDEALQTLSAITPDHPAAGIASLAFAADWCIEAERYRPAETYYRRWITQQPEAVQAIRPLAYLLNRQGRRIEATSLLRRLCIIGDVTEDELVAMVAPVDSIVKTQSDIQRYRPLGRLGWARHYFSNQQFDRAIETIRVGDWSTKNQPAASALLGRCLAEGGHVAQCASWWQAIEPDIERMIEQFPDYWVALAITLRDLDLLEQSAAAFLQALRIDPSDRFCIGQLLINRDIAGDQDAANLLRQWRSANARLRSVVATFTNIDFPPPSQYRTIADAMLTADRPLESVYWRYLAAKQSGQLDNLGPELSRQRAAIIQSDQAFPEVTKGLFRLRSIDFTRSELSAIIAARSQLPEHSAARNSVAANESTIQSWSDQPPRFRNAAKTMGLTHRFDVASKPIEDGFQLHQTLGGGVAVVDWQLDGTEDLWLATGGSDFPEFRGDVTGRLWRLSDGQFVDQTLAAGLGLDRYTIGVTAGDFNADGWPDLAASTMFGPMLWIGQGDGTARLRRLPELAGPAVPASLAIADVTGDGIADLIEARYIEDPNMDRRPRRDAQGRIAQPMGPPSFKHARDRVTTQSVATELRSHWLGQPEDRAPGLGLLIGRLDDSLDEVSSVSPSRIQPTRPNQHRISRRPTHANQIFIGNDTKPNQFWSLTGNDQWTDLAPPLGVAFGGRGTATASMGIAAADFDQNQSLDFVVTNFADEANNFFVRQNGTYIDRAFICGLGQHSVSRLGFGCQPIDWNNDTNIDLFVTNGHVEKLRGSEDRFRQRPQFFQSTGTRFERVEPSNPSGYSDTQHLGRAVATADFNHDGRLDLVVTHVGEQTAVLINQTGSLEEIGPVNETELTQAEHSCLRLVLAGTASNRDGIGGVVQVRSSDRTRRFWITTGDGYLARNSSILHIGLGNRHAVDELSVVWPSGQIDQFEDVAGGRIYLAVEGQSSLFDLKKASTPDAAGS